MRCKPRMAIVARYLSADLTYRLGECDRLANKWAFCLFHCSQSTVALPLKSILKPTIPVSPIRNIPSFEETRRRTPARGVNEVSDDTDQHGNGSSKEGLLIDFETPPHPTTTGTSGESNPYDAFNASSVIRDSMVAAKEREEQEKSEHERQRILEQREARRKSMGE